jgi:ELWxxDGT repeat protein
MRQFIVLIQLSFFLPTLGSQSLIKNINLGAQGSNINHLQSATSGIIFTANDEDGSRILCFTNDTISEPQILYKSGNPPAYQWIWTPKAVGDSVFYFTYYPDKVQLFMVNPLTETTTFLKEWQNSNGFSSDLGQFTRVGNLVYFITRFTNYQFELWSTDGSASGTNFVALLPSNSFPTNLIELGGKLIF